MTMENLLLDLKAHNLQNRTVALIENGTWAATAAGQMKSILASMKDMNVIENSVSLKSSVKPEKRVELVALADALCETLKKCY